MAFEPLKVNSIDIKKEKGKSYTGYFTGCDPITTKLGPQVIWRFKGKDGSLYGIYGFTNLNFCMKNAQIGALIRITYMGTKNMQTKFGMKDVHQALVEIDKADTMHDGAGETEGDPAPVDENPFQ